MWVVPLSHLTEDQLSAVQLSSAKHRVIVGGPGSGKTLVLAHRAQRLLAAGAAPDGLPVFVFTNVLASYLKEGLTELGLPPGTVSTFDSWCLGLFDSLVGGPRPTAWSGGRAVGIDFEAMRLAVLAKVEVTRPAPVLEVALVDEGQDLSESAIRLIAAASKHVTLAMDARRHRSSPPIGARRSSSTSQRNSSRRTRSLRSSGRRTSCRSTASRRRCSSPPRIRRPRWTSSRHSWASGRCSATRARSSSPTAQPSEGS